MHYLLLHLVWRIINTEQAADNDNDDTIALKLNGMRIAEPSACTGILLLIDCKCKPYLLVHSIGLEENSRMH